jgi:hypothetical protein
MYFKEKNIEETYVSSYGDAKQKWPITVMATYNSEKNKARDDVAAFISQANNLIREYNSQSEKFNWSLFNTRADKPPQKFQEYN